MQLSVQPDYYGYRAMGQASQSNYELAGGSLLAPQQQYMCRAFLSFNVKTWPQSQTDLFTCTTMLHCGHTFLRCIDLSHSIACTTVLHSGHKVKRGNSSHSLTLNSNTVPKVHNEELAKQWSLTLLSMYYLLQTTHFNRWFTYMRKSVYFKSCVLNMRKWSISGHL